MSKKERQESLPADVPAYNPPVDLPLEYIYTDDDILVVNKPSGLLSVPGRGAHLSDCLQSRVQKKYPAARIVHRLDMDTSGLLVLALNPQAHKRLGWQFEKRAVEKTYIARVFGSVPHDSGVINLPMRCDWPNRPRQMIDYELGREAVTEYKVIERDAHQITRVALHPLTGRSHQLRVHMQALGYPILGDCFYAPPEAFHMTDRLNLHAAELIIYHPVSNVRMCFKSACPF